MTFWIEHHIQTYSNSSCRHPSLKDVVLHGGTTPLILACQSGEFDSVRHLIQDLGISVHASAKYVSDPSLLNSSKHAKKIRLSEASPLFVAAFHGHSRIVRYLLEREADLSVKLSPKDCDLVMGEFDGWTPLHAAVCCF